MIRDLGVVNTNTGEGFMTEKVYYEQQNDWNEEDYYYLHRVLHRVFFYHDKHTEEIKNMDVSMMTDNTKALIYCIIKYYHYDFLFEKYDNLKPLENTIPLSKTLVLDSNPLPENNIYKLMNIMY